MTAADWLRYGSAAAALLDAALWFKAASIVTPAQIVLGTNAVQSGNDGSIGVDVDTSMLDDLAKALRKQASWNQWAAGMAAVAAALGAAAMIVSRCACWA